PAPAVVSADSAVVFRDVILPILNEKCAGCHNPGKAKNKLIVTSYAHLVRGGDSKDLLVPGKAARSLLYTYATLPPDDSLHMPPKGKPQLDAEEVKLIGWWINNGASEHQSYAAASRPDSIHPLMLARFQPKTGVDLLDIPFADREQIAALNTPYRTVQQLSVTRPYLHVFMGSRRTFSPGDLKELGNVREQIVSVDLAHTRVQDGDLKELAGFPHLRKLHLQHTAVTDAGVRHLAGLRYLESLNLSGTGITAALLTDLAAWPALKTVFLSNTSIAEAQAAALQQARPGLAVHGTGPDVTDSLYYAQLVAPEVKVDSLFFRQAATVTVKAARGKVQYYYTLDGSQPDRNSLRYEGPFPVRTSARLRMIAVMDGWKDSKPLEQRLLHLGVRPDKVVLETAPDAGYRDRLDTTLVDGVDGPAVHDEGKYLGYRGSDLKAGFSFDEPRSFATVTVSYLESVDQQVMPPAFVEVWGGEHPGRLRKLGTVRTDYPAKSRPAAKYQATLALPNQPLRYLRIVAGNTARLPAWHHSAKSAKPAKPLMLIDEVAFQ
ncbi:MAG: chitobiase/beta-hexosaminidase C-terminal domain-containing protein, partial [Cytophagales bacterium]|nr:chitobiase/beta-hexosaminidase C-terminal domain-containing protein [Cytophagales bacterium]